MQNIDNTLRTSTVMEFTEAALRAAGFRGFVPFSALGSHSDAEMEKPGVYAVLRPAGIPMALNNASTGFWYKDKNPAYPLARLQSRWELPTPVLYFGKAGYEYRGPSLRTRLGQYRDYGAGKNVGHRGGRAIWQLQGAAELLLVCWIATPGLHPECVERQLLRQFKSDFDLLPMANQQVGEQDCDNTPKCHWEPTMP